MLPVIALVGRPNVGKSTLFNVLTHSKDALVGDRPGLTRDRQYGQGYCGDRKYIVVDTGGLASQYHDLLAGLMAEQSQQAILEADLVFFLVDARDGVLPDDFAIAKHLRKLNKKIILIVNKIDGVKQLPTVLGDFFQLGLGEAVPIAASHGRGVGLLLEQVLPPADKTPASKSVAASIKFAIIGRPNVGKSTLVNRMLGEDRVVVCDLPGTTRDSVSIPFERHGKAYTIIDTAGVRRRGKIDDFIEKFSVIKTLQAIEAAQVVVMVFDAQEGIADQDLHLLGFALETGRSLVLAINKWDGLTEEQKERVKVQLDFKINFLDYAKILFISALHGTCVGNLFDEIELCHTAAYVQVSTAKVTQMLQAAIVQHQPPLSKGRRIKLRYAHMGGHNPPIIVIHGTQAEAIPVSYKRFLEKFYREKLALTGTPVRIQLRNSDNPYIKIDPKKPQVLSKYHKRKGQTQGQKKPAVKPAVKGVKPAGKAAVSKPVHKTVRQPAKRMVRKPS